MKACGHHVAEQIRRDAELARQLHEDEMEVDGDACYDHARGHRQRDRTTRGVEQRSQPRKDAARAVAARHPARRGVAHIRSEQDEEYLRSLRVDQEREAAEQHARQQKAVEEEAGEEKDADDEDAPLSLADMRQARLEYFSRQRVAI